MLAALISFPIGFCAGLRRGGVLDQSSRIFFTLSFAMPAFWLGIILILIFSVHLHVFPLSGFGRGFFGHLYYLFLPAFTIALGFSTVLVRSLRAATIATLQAEFIDTARMKGIRWSQVLWRHVFRNAVLAVVAVYGVNLAYLISGTVLVENVFSLPGLGTLLVSSVANRDYPVVQGVTLLFAVLIVAINLLTDIVQAALDPRVGQEIGEMSTTWATSPSELLMQGRHQGRRAAPQRDQAAADADRRAGPARHRDPRRHVRSAPDQRVAHGHRPAAPAGPAADPRSPARHRPVRPGRAGPGSCTAGGSTSRSRSARPS